MIVGVQGVQNEPPVMSGYRTWITVQMKFKKSCLLEDICIGQVFNGPPASARTWLMDLVMSEILKTLEVVLVPSVKASQHKLGCMTGKMTRESELLWVCAGRSLLSDLPHCA